MNDIRNLHDINDMTSERDLYNFRPIINGYYNPIINLRYRDEVTPSNSDMSELRMIGDSRPTIADNRPFADEHAEYEMDTDINEELQNLQHSSSINLYSFVLGPDGYTLDNFHSKANPINTECIVDKIVNSFESIESINIIDKTCSICSSILSENVVKTKCDHYYHRKCISEWIGINPSCPLCRYKFIQFHTNEKMEDVD